MKNHKKLISGIIFGLLLISINFGIPYLKQYRVDKLKPVFEEYLASHYKGQMVMMYIEPINNGFLAAVYPQETEMMGFDVKAIKNGHGGYVLSDDFLLRNWEYQIKTDIESYMKGLYSDIYSVELVLSNIRSEDLMSESHTAEESMLLGSCKPDMPVPEYMEVKHRLAELHFRMGCRIYIAEEYNASNPEQDKSKMIKLCKYINEKGYDMDYLNVSYVKRYTASISKDTGYTVQTGFIFDKKQIASGTIPQMQQ